MFIMKLHVIEQQNFDILVQKPISTIIYFFSNLKNRTIFYFYVYQKTFVHILMIKEMFITDNKKFHVQTMQL